MRRMFRYEAEKGYRAADLRLTGDPVAVAALPGCEGIEFWAEYDDSQPSRLRWFMVLATGAAVPSGAVWRGTTARMPDGHVWHLYELAEMP